MFEVLEPGHLSSIQDAGREEYTDLGVPHGGACDPWSLAAANVLMNNEPGAAAVEITLGGLVLRCLRSCFIALTGADLGAYLPDAYQRLGVGAVHAVSAGASLAFRGGERGARAYLALAGGVDAPVVLGSRSASLVGELPGLAGRGLGPGDVLEGVDLERSNLAGKSWPHDLVPLEVDTRAPIRLLPGPHEGHFPGGIVGSLTGAQWRVSPRSDRVGMRLTGPSLPVLDRPFVSQGMVWGAIQVPPDGQPILLLPDHQTTGGYPVASVVIRADRAVLGQLRPMDAVRFRAVSMEEAQEAQRSAERSLASVRGALHGA
ncbi:MAG: biotin-dependent carboxyltransferase family protein [Candidatus Limnocylindrales bacterium]